MGVIKGPMTELKGIVCHSELLDQLHEAVDELALNMKTTVTIVKGPKKVGFGVDKTQRGIAADTVISIAKAIKALKGW